MKKKILVVTGTRAEYGLLRSTMDAIRGHSALELKLLVTGVHTLEKYGNTLEGIRKDGYTINCIVPVTEGDDMLQALTREIAGIREYFMKERPDCVVVLGDRDEPFAAAVVAAHLNIPIAHIHGGDTTGPGVDESIRHAITKFAHLHFPGTKKSARRIRALAEERRRIFNVGSVVVDMALQEKRFSRETAAKELGLDSDRPWLTIIQHPTAFESVPIEEQFKPTIEALGAFPQHEKIFLYPNTDTGSDTFVKELGELTGPRHHVRKSLPRLIYMSAVAESDALVGNSSAGVIETAYLGTPTVNIGDRQKGRERGKSVIDAPYDTKKITTGIQRAIAMNKRNGKHPFASPYGKAGAGKRIADVLAKELAQPHLLDKKFTASHSRAKMVWFRN